MRTLLLLLVAACGRPAEAKPADRAQPLAELRGDAGTDAILPPESSLPDAGLLLDSGIRLVTPRHGAHPAPGR